MSNQIKIRPYKKMRGGMILGLFLGLLIGILGAAIVVWTIQKTPAPFLDKTNNVAPSASGTESGAQANTPGALAGKPGDTPQKAGAEDEARFDFYKILPGTTDSAEAKKNEPMSNDKKDVKDDKEAKDDKTERVIERVFLQTGAFQSAAEADSQKAKLAFMGIEASVQQVMVQEKTWYRVRLGAFSREEAERIRDNLKKDSIEANIVK